MQEHNSPMEFSKPTRTEEQTSSAADAAGLKDSVGAVNVLHFSPNLHSEDIRLLELPNPVLSALREGEKVVIRGKSSDEAVLCTKDKTFEVRVADTSNSLLIAPTLQLPRPQVKMASSEAPEERLRSCEVLACLGSYLELRQCRPHLERLKLLLSECPFRGSEYETDGKGENGCGESGGGTGTVAEESLPMWSEEDMLSRKRKEAPKKYRFEDLVGVVQASEAELRAALHKVQACLVDGYWRILDLDYRDEVLQQILTLLEEKDWPTSRVPLNASCDTLRDLHPRFAIEHCLRCYGKEVEKMDEGSDFDASETYYELLEERVCQFFAELLLRPAGKFIFQDFMDSWQQSVPEGMETSLEQLKGIALTDMTSAPPVIWHFPHSDLPQDPANRFQQLFEVKAKWSMDEIEPYIRDLEGPAQSLKSLLMKHTRVSTSASGLKVYSSRKILAR